MFCMKCGRRLEDDSRFCAACGTPVGQTAKSPTPAAAARGNGAEAPCCKNCGKPLTPGTPFCLSCGNAVEPAQRGAPAQGRFPPAGGPYTVRFSDSGSEEKLMEQINAWLAQHPTVEVTGCKFDTGLGLGMLTNRTVLRTVTLQYRELGRQNTDAYRLEHLVWLGLYARDASALLEDWKQAHPGARVVSVSGSTNSRGQMGSLMLGGIGAMNRVALYILYRQPGAAPRPPAREG